MRLGGEGFHVMQAACAVVDFCDQGYGDVLGDVFLNLFRRDDAQFVALAERFDEAFGHVEIRGEVAAV